MPGARLGVETKLPARRKEPSATHPVARLLPTHLVTPRIHCGSAAVFPALHLPMV